MGAGLQVGFCFSSQAQDVSLDMEPPVKPDEKGWYPTPMPGMNRVQDLKKCFVLLRDHGYHGSLNIECEGQGGPMIERSLKWLRGTLAELKFPVEG